jgi:hypothetical protein
MARSTYFDQGRIADACPGSESGYAQRFQCGNIVKRLIWTRMMLDREADSCIITGALTVHSGSCMESLFPRYVSCLNR